MGKYFDWKNRFIKSNEPADSGDKLTAYLNSIGFIYSIEVTDINIDESIVNHPEITESTDDEWTGFFCGPGNICYLFFKDETDAVAAKLRWI